MVMAIMAMMSFVTAGVKFTLFFPYGDPPFLKSAKTEQKLWNDRNFSRRFRKINLPRQSLRVRRAERRQTQETDTIVCVCVY